MNTIMTSVVAGSLLATLAIAQPSPLGEVDNGTRPFGHAEVQPALSQTNSSAQMYRWWGRPKPPGPSREDHHPPSRRLVYVITGGLQFGVVDLHRGTFLPIGQGLPPDVGAGLAPGRGSSLLTLSFSGNLEALDPATGRTTLIGATGLADCSTPISPCGPFSANVLGILDETYYATDFAQNLYSVNPKTGAAKRIGPTGIPAVTFVPFSSNPDGTLNVYVESLFSVHGKLYANFATAALDPATGTVKAIIPGTLYEINPERGHATLIAPTDTSLTTIVNVDDTIYAFDAATGQVVTLDVRNGLTAVVSDLDPSAGVITGATPAGSAAGKEH